MTTEKFTLEGLRTELDSFFVRAPDPEEASGESYNLHVEFGWRVIREVKRVDVRVTCAWNNNEEIGNLETTLLRCVLISSVQVPELFVRNEEVTISTIPRELKAALLDIALGTMRGVVKTRSEGFAISKFELPVFNSMLMVEQAAPS